MFLEFYNRSPFSWKAVKTTENCRILDARLICINPIQKSSFVCEYAGEIIDEAKALQRSKKDSKNYILYVKEHFSSGEKVTIIDPTKIGNIGRYINHSCDPNLSLQVVRVESLCPSVALFACRDIEAKEELTFDYGYDSSTGTMKCLCNSSNCRGFLPLDKFINV